MIKNSLLILDRSVRRHRNVRVRKIAAIQNTAQVSKPWIKQSTSWAINKTLCLLVMVKGLGPLKIQWQMPMNHITLSLSRPVIMAKVRSDIRAKGRSCPHRWCHRKFILQIYKRIKLWLTHQEEMNYHQKTRLTTSLSRLTSVRRLLPKCHSLAMVLLMVARLTTMVVCKTALRAWCLWKQIRTTHCPS